jgi:Flp pilus assembly protein TadD
MIALDQRQVEQARRIWEQVVGANPRIALAQRGLGVIAVLQDRPIDALLNLEASRLIDPTDPIVYIYLGIALEALERPKEAVVEYIQVLSLTTDPILLNWVQERVKALDQQSMLGDTSQKGGANSVLP